jgi:energy-converting hydrogenase Eha subunit G
VNAIVFLRFLGFFVGGALGFLVLEWVGLDDISLGWSLWSFLFFSFLLADRSRVVPTRMGKGKE